MLRQRGAAEQGRQSWGAVAIAGCGEEWRFPGDAQKTDAASKPCAGEWCPGRESHRTTRHHWLCSYEPFKPSPQGDDLNPTIQADPRTAKLRGPCRVGRNLRDRDMSTCPGWPLV